MPNTINIPTPLRPFTDKKEAVEVSGATVGELLADLDDALRGTPQASLCRQRQAAELRERVSERRGHPLPAEGSDAGEVRRHAEHRAVGRGWGADATRRRASSDPSTGICRRKRSSATAGT